MKKGKFTMKKNTAQLLGFLLAFVISVGLIGADLVASANTSNDNDNKTANGRVARRAENSNNSNAGETNNRTKPRGTTTTTGTTSGGNKNTHANQQNCKGKGCNQKGTHG
jgi:hypothetical protein